jgi:Heparinase II/III-like protein/Heparinase II/III N-terminus
MTSAGWYLRRLSRMGPREVAGRAVTAARIRRWRRVAGQPIDATVWLAERCFSAGIDGEAVAAIPPAAAARLVATADQLMDGHAEYFGTARHDMVNPDWSFDPRTGRRAPVDVYAFDIPYRDEAAVGDIKQLWEPSRHQHLTVLAAAFALTGELRYAHRVADHLKSWWAANPPMRGVHWVSGIELGIRLLSWVWVRRLLDTWPGAPGLFEDNPEALHQIWHHQRWLAALGSHGSSANNHVIAEAAGQLAAACAFTWFPETPRWRAKAMRTLDEQLRRNTFPSGLNRELATEYHGLVLELGLAATLEASAAGVPVPDSTWHVLLRMTDALAAVVDARLRPPRQGDADDGHGLAVDGAGTDRWASLLANGEALFGRQPWWPALGEASDARTPLLAALATAPPLAVTRPGCRPAHFADAGLTILRGRLRPLRPDNNVPADVPAEPPAGTPATPRADAFTGQPAELLACAPEAETPAGSELWCRCDGGPHGFLSIAAHAHADALSVEVRHDGVDVLADPGTYCYHGQPAWRAYFRSTLGHNTLQLDDRDQSTSGGPFMWTRHARSQILAAPIDGPAAETGVIGWCAEHDGYVRGRRSRSAMHRRLVELDEANWELRILDEVLDRKPHPCRLAFHLGPLVHADLAGDIARLTWTSDGVERAALLELPQELTWTAHRGETSPPLGWYSPGFGRIEPTWTLLGAGRAGGPGVLTTVLRFDP